MNVQNYNILIVEDDPFQLDMIKRSISSDSVHDHYTLVDSKKKAWEALKKDHYDLIVSDFFLTDGKGDELIREQPNGQNVPVVIMTSWGNEQIRLSVIEDGALDFVVKSSRLLMDLPSMVVEILNNQDSQSKDNKFKLLFENERKLLNLFMDNIPDTIYFKDTQSRFIRINKAKAEKHGLNDPILAIGKSDFDFFGHEHAQKAFDDEQKIMATGNMVRKEEKETWPDGRETWVSSVKIPYYDPSGMPAGTFGISKDI